jgi:hypothetical protein
MDAAVSRGAATKYLENYLGWSGRANTTSLSQGFKRLLTEKIIQLFWKALDYSLFICLKIYALWHISKNKKLVHTLHQA